MGSKNCNKALSLNDSHYRYLQHLPTNPSLQNPNPNPSAIKDDQTIPLFSAITDFDSPSPIGQNSAEKHRPIKLLLEEEEDVPPNVENIPPTLSQSYPKGEENVKTKMKVKVEGRRRLCKVAYSNKGDGSVDKKVVVDQSNADDVINLDTPFTVKESKGGNEIRDILNDLSAKFELLSVERNRVKEREPREDEVVEYGSAGSSFSPEQDPPKVTNNASGAIEYVEDDEK